MIIMTTRTKTPACVIPKTFEANRINIPKAPGLGLLLEKVSREQYACFELLGSYD